MYLNKFRLILSVMCGLIVHQYCCGQENYIRKTYTTTDGLAYNNVQSICQDKNGFYWIATWDGLSRFDGYEFKNFFHVPEDSTSFPFFSLDKVLVDDANNLWVFSEGKPAALYDRVKERFHRVFIDSGSGAMLGDIVNGPDSCIWMTHAAMVTGYNAFTGKIKSYRITDSSGGSGFPDNTARSVSFDNKGKMWLFYFEGKNYRVYSENKRSTGEITFRYAGILSPKNLLSISERNTFFLFNIFVTDSGRTYFFTKYGLYYVDKQSDSIVDFKGSPEIAEFSGAHNLLWADDISGIHIVDQNSKKIINIETKQNSFLEAAYIDNFGNLWTGETNHTHENVGLNRYSQIPHYFRNYLTESSEVNSFNLVFPVVKDLYGSIWAGTRNHSYLYEIQADGKTAKLDFNKYRDVIPDSKARSLACDSLNIWIGTNNSQLLKYNIKNRQLSVIYPTLLDTSDGKIVFQKILITGKDLVINGGFGVYKYDGESGKISIKKRYSRSGTTFTIVSDGSDGYWLGHYTNEVEHLDRKFNTTFRKRLGTEANVVAHICPGDSNDIWVALQGGGLGHYNLSTRKYNVFSTLSGLSSNVIYGILKDKRGKLWLSTNDGISRFDPLTAKFRNFGIKDGLVIREFNSDSYFIDDNGVMYFGGVGGMVAFNPGDVFMNLNEDRIPEIIITGLKVSGRVRDFNRPLYTLDTLRLQKGDNNFQLSFACLNIKTPELAKFRYRLNGKDNEWFEADPKSRMISFMNLAHKNYTLEIETKIDEGDWLGNKKIHIDIPDRFFEIIWVRLFAVLFILICVAAAIAVYIQNLKYKAKQTNDELRLSALRGQMNPHFIFNSLNSINYFIAIEDKKAVNDYIADFSRLIRSILNNMSSEYIPLEKEIESVNDYLKLEHMRFSDKFDYSLDYSSALNLDEISVFPGMVQPFIENAIWHGFSSLENRKGFLSIEYLRGSGDSIKCIIKDDGIGRTLAKSTSGKQNGKRSRGTDIVRERLVIINQSLKKEYKLKIEDLFTDRPETGTIVTIEIPVRNF